MKSNTSNINKLKTLPAFTGEVIQNKDKLHEYPFINLVRFLSMMGIVWAHAELVHPAFSATDYLHKVGHMELYIPFKQIFKFAVLSFFIISGFLLGDRLDLVDTFSYHKRRLNSTMKPYLLAFSLFVGLILFRTYFLNRTGSQSISSVLNFTLFDTLYWYLPNYFICLLILLFFKRYLKSAYFGAALFGLNIGYTYFTIYHPVFTFGHTDFTAICSYLFYLWLVINIRQKGWISKIKTLNVYLLLAIVISAYLLSCIESYFLYEHHLQYFNILRFCNQIYTVAMFMFLVRVCSEKPNFKGFNPRQETFGIYLYHGFFVYFIVPKALVWSYTSLHIDWYSYNIYVYLFSLLLFFVTCYMLTVLLVKALLHFNLGYLKTINHKKLKTYKL